MCRDAPFFGQDRGIEILDKIRILDGDNEKSILDRLYAILNILDGKANGLLQVNGILITALIFFVGFSRDEGDFSHYVRLSAIEAILLVASSVLCMLVARVKWKFLKHMEADLAPEARRLANVIDDRTWFYRCAWWATLIALLLPSVTWLLFKVVQ